MDKLIRIFAQPIGFAGTAFGIAGLIYLGISLASGGRRQPEIVKAIAMIVAGFTVAADNGALWLHRALSSWNLRIFKERNLAYALSNHD
ncbi:MAG: hypothetical protein ACLUBO_14920 [Coprococcus sp.]